MTLAEMARQLNTSTMTIYRRLDKAGLKIADMRDADTGEITAEGMAVIGGLFTTTGATQPTTGATTTTTTRTQPTTQHDAQPVEVEAAVLRERVQGLTDKLLAVEAERDRLLSQVATLTEMLQNEQRQRQMLLTDGRQRHGGLFGWRRRNRGTDGSGGND